MPPTFDFRGKTALVTGGGRGIGRGISRALGAAGAFVFVNYLNDRESADSVAAEIVAGGGRAVAVQADVSEPAAVKAMFRKCADSRETIDILVNNASLEFNRYIWDLKDSEWEASIKTTLSSPFYCSKYVLPYMVKSPNGKIVNISSIHDSVPRKAAAPYCAGKAGLLMLTEVMALELAPYNIQVNAVSPGLTLTDRTKGILGKDGEVDESNPVVAANPMHRAGSVDEVVTPVLYLCSDASSYTTGTTIYVDGGYRHNLCPEREESLYGFLDQLKEDRS